MAALDGFSLHVITPFTPQFERPSQLTIPLLKPTFRAPQGEHGAVDAPASLSIGVVVITIYRSSRSVFLANRMHMNRIAKRLHICIPNRLWEDRLGRIPLAQSIIHYRLGRPHYQPFW